jgi:hypothetical protein
MANFSISYPKWNITEYTGYEPKTTYWMDFSIADRFGLNAIKDTYNDAMRNIKSGCLGVVYLTELVMVLNWKISQFYEKDMAKARLYNDLWQKADLYAQDNLSGDELQYFYRTTD